MKKILCILFVLLMLASLTACSNNVENNRDNVSSDQSNQSAEESDPVKTDRVGLTYNLAGLRAEENGVTLGIPEAELDPQQVYSTLNYTPEMFYGSYGLLGGNEADEAYGEKAAYFTCELGGEALELTMLPFEIQAGKHTLNHVISAIPEYEFMRLSFMKRYELNAGEYRYTLKEIWCAYEIDGHKLLLRPMETYDFDGNTNTIIYSLADFTWEFDFSFAGQSLTLTHQDESITLMTGLDAYRKEEHFSVEHYVSPDSKALQGIDLFDICMSDAYDLHSICLMMQEGSYEEQYKYDSVALLEENGLLTFTLSGEDEVKTYQYVYFYCGFDGIILTDGKEVYYYNSNWSDRQKNTLSAYVSEEVTAQLDELSDSELSTVVEKTANLLADLAMAYTQAGMKVTVDPTTGEIAMDSTVLFEVNASEISEEGKAFLQQFMRVYSSVVFNEKYEGFISTILVEGHTDTSGSYDLNQALSQQRADNIRAYCLSEECGISGDYLEVLQTMMEAKGYAYDRPVYDENGEIDMDASRRVSFRCLIDLSSF